MSDEKIEFRTSILNVPDTITPLRFQEWLRQEAINIQKNCTDASFIIVKLFLPMRVRLAFTHAQLDALLQGIPDAHPNIHWIDVVLVDQSLTNEEMNVFREKEQKELSRLTQSVADFLRSKNPR